MRDQRSAVTRLPTVLPEGAGVAIVMRMEIGDSPLFLFQVAAKGETHGGHDAILELRFAA